MKLNRQASQLLIIDVQERLLPVIAESEAMVAKCGQLLEGADLLGVPILISEQYRKGLGATAAPLLAKGNRAKLMEKMHFSCADDPAMLAEIETRARAGRRQCVLAGIEAHICVMQTALDLQALGFEVVLASDGIASRNPAHAAEAKARAQLNGIATAPVESVLFEWMKKSGGETFKKISALVK